MARRELDASSCISYAARMGEPDGSTEAPSEPSRYLEWRDMKLVSDGGVPAAVPASFVHDQLRGMVLAYGFPCLGARAAVRQSNYRFGLYPPLGSKQSTPLLARDLARFVDEPSNDARVLRTFIASFNGPNPRDEMEFERLLWTQLQGLHDADVLDWDASVSSDATDPLFSFSFARSAFFIAGLHAGSSRWSRRFSWPTLVFNPHRQFELLRSAGRFERFRTVIAQRDATLQGSANPILESFGVSSECRQYSGRNVEAAWRCPLNVHRKDRKRAALSGGASQRQSAHDA
jgi:FPC/CPF motif-containing protein YcgG